MAEFLLENARILIVDDADFHRANAEGMLRSIGVKNIMQAENGQEALDIIRGHAIDLVLLDYIMPGLSGIEVLQAVRADRNIANTRIVLVTAANETKVIIRARAKDTSADAIIIKPYTIGTLESKFRQLLTQK